MGAGDGDGVGEWVPTTHQPLPCPLERARIDSLTWAATPLPAMARRGPCGVLKPVPAPPVLTPVLSFSGGTAGEPPVAAAISSTLRR